MRATISLALLLALAVVGWMTPALADMPGRPMGRTGGGGGGGGGGDAYVLKAGDTMTGDLVHADSYSLFQVGGTTQGRIRSGTNQMILEGGGPSYSSAVMLNNNTAYIGTHDNRSAGQKVACVAESVTDTDPSELVCVYGNGTLMMTAGGNIQMADAALSSSAGDGLWIVTHDGKAQFDAAGGVKVWGPLEVTHTVGANTVDTPHVISSDGQLNVVADNIHLAAIGNTLALYEDEARWETTTGAGDIVLAPQGGVDGSVQVWGDLQQTVGNYFRISKTATNATVSQCTAPLACNAEGAGAMFYCEDTSLSKQAGLCLCKQTSTAGGGAPVYQWVGIPDDTSVCPE